MLFPKSANYDKEFIKQNMMGPNAIKILEQLLSGLDLKAGSRVLDLGCGTGLTSIFLAKEYGVRVFATDLWITATENYERFKAQGLDDLIVPIHADAAELPYAQGYFDAVFSIDAYYYFGLAEDFMDSKLAPLIKSGGDIAIAFPGVKEELTDYPAEFEGWDEAELRKCFHACPWWRELLAKSKKITDLSVREMPQACHDECWNDWLASDNEYAVSDRKPIRAGAGKYLNLISIIAKKL